MSRTQIYQLSALALCLAAAIAILFIRQQPTQEAASKSKTPPVIAPPLSIGEIKPNVPSLLNAVPPEFEPAHAGSYLPAELQLAKGEEHIIAKPSELIHLHIRCSLANGWFTYAPKQTSRMIQPNTFLLNDQPVAKIDGEIASTAPAIVDPNWAELNEKVYLLDRDHVYDIPIRIAENSTTGRINLSLALNSDSWTEKAATQRKQHPSPSISPSHPPPQPPNKSPHLSHHLHPPPQPARRLHERQAFLYP